MQICEKRGRDSQAVLVASCSNMIVGPALPLCGAVLEINST